MLRQLDRITKSYAMRGRLCFIALVSTTIISQAAAHAAGFRPRVEAVGSAIVINGAIAARVPGDDAVAQAASIARSLTTSGCRSTLAIRVNRHSWAVVTCGGDRLFLVTRKMAKSIGETADGIANNMASRLTQLLQEPALSLMSLHQPLIVPVGGMRSVTLGGAAPAYQISVRDTSSANTHTTFTASGRALSVEGIAPGTALVTAVARDGHGGSENMSLSCIVEDVAGKVQPEADATVSGQPFADRSLALQAARNALYRAVLLKPGAYLEVISQPNPISSVFPATQTNLSSTVRAVGSDMIPDERNVSVVVSNDGDYSPRVAQSLFYSNNPETIKRPQTLFSADLPAYSRPTRLVYHHINSSNQALGLRIEVVNTSTVSTTIHLIRGDGGPGVDPVVVGYKAGDQFLQDWLRNSGLFLTIPPSSRIELLVQRMLPGQVLSGILEITQTNGPDKSLKVRVAAEPYTASNTGGFDALINPADQLGAYMLLPLTDNFRSALNAQLASDEIYTTPSLSVNGAYQVGSNWMYLNVGTKDAIGRKTGRKQALDGNYGVIYNFNISLSNPAVQTRVVTLSFEAGAGLAAGLFVVDGQRTVINPVYPTDEQEIARYTLAAGETRVVHLQTMPLSGSAYPARIVAHAL